MTTRQHQQNRQEEQNRRDQRNRDIDLYGYAGAFSRDSRMTYEKAEWLKKNNKLRGEM